MSAQQHTVRSLVALILWCLSYFSATGAPQSFSALQDNNRNQYILRAGANEVISHNAVMQKGKESEQNNIARLFVIGHSLHDVVRSVFYLQEKNTLLSFHPLSLYLIYTEITASRL